MPRCAECGCVLNPDERGFCEYCAEAADLDHDEADPGDQDPPAEETERSLPDMCPYYC